MFFIIPLSIIIIDLFLFYLFSHLFLCIFEKQVRMYCSISGEYLGCFLGL